MQPKAMHAGSSGVQPTVWPLGIQPELGGLTLMQSLTHQSQTMLQLLPEQPAGQASCTCMLFVHFPCRGRCWAVTGTADVVNLYVCIL